MLIQEFKGTPQILGKGLFPPLRGNPIAVSSVIKPLLFLAPALKNQETDHLFLNKEDELQESRVVIEKGVAWEYSNKDNQESIQTQGPLKYGVLLMVGATVHMDPMC